MTGHAKLDKPLATIFGYLALLASIVGVLAGLAIALLGLEGLNAVRIVNFALLTLAILFPLTLIGLIRRHAQYWIGLCHQQQTECIGKLLGSGVFASLLALSVHVLVVIGITNALSGEGSSITTELLRASYSVINILGIATITTLVGFAYLWLTPKEQL